MYRRSCCQSRPASGAVREIIRGAVPIVVGVVPCFQSSMLLHNLSSIFSLSKKASQRALRCTHLPHRTAAITHPAANAHQATPCPPITGTNPNAPGRKPAPDRNGPIRRKTGFPQSLHRVFHIFAGFPQRLSFPLAFFERDRVRYAYAVRSYCAVRPGLVWSGMVGYGTVPRYFCATSRVTKPPAGLRPPAPAPPVTSSANRCSC